jgi:AICAR transformylase/IMP cyclohydrolase PurH
VELRYGINPHQVAAAKPVTDGRWPITVVNGTPSYINLLDALEAWQLVREAAASIGGPIAASFKHVSPAGAATDGAIDAVTASTWDVRGDELTPLARAYVRARDCDPKSSFGDVVAVSDAVDLALAEVLRTVVSDGIIAPAFEPGVVDVLAAKKHRSYLIIEADPTFVPPRRERRELFGVAFEQDHDELAITAELIADAFARPLPSSVVRDLVLAMVTARHTQSNSVTYAKDGAVVGIGAGQQSRVDCTRLAGDKVDTWWLRRHPRVEALTMPPGVRRQDAINSRLRFIEEELSDLEKAGWIGHLDAVVMASDGFLPFRDNVDEASRHGVRFIADPGGSTRSAEVIAACAEHGIELGTTGVRLFHH